MDRIYTKIKTVFSEQRGDILVFVSGEGEAEDLAESIRKKLDARSVVVLPLYSGLPEEEIDEILRPSDKRKIIISTNVAESGITIDGVVSVIDSMLQKRKETKRMGSVEVGLIIEGVISQASSMQRRGRAGRTQPGHYYPLCTVDRFAYLQKHFTSEFEAMQKHIPVLELLTDELPAHEILLLPRDQYDDIIMELQRMGLYDGTLVTDMGREVIQFPLSINTAVALVHALEEFMGIDPLKVIYMIFASAVIDTKAAVPNPVFVPREERKHRREFIETYMSDYMMNDDVTSLVKMVADYMLQSCKVGSKKLGQWCKEQNINFKFMKASLRLIEQLKYIIDPKMKIDRGILEDLVFELDDGSLNATAIQHIFKTAYAGCDYIFVKQYPRVTYEKNYSEFSVDMTSLMRYRFPPTKVLALSCNFIKSGNRTIQIIGLCIPIS
jgi:HrpA-like RNA helicase